MIQLDIRKSELDKKIRLRLPVFSEIRLRLHPNTSKSLPLRLRNPSRTTCKMNLLKLCLILFLEVSRTVWKRTSIFRLLSTRRRTTASKNKRLRHVDVKSLDAHEDLVDLYETENAKAETITKIIKDSVCRLGLDLGDCRGQEYDEAYNMKGCLSGVQARMTSGCPKANFLSTAFVIL